MSMLETVDAIQSENSDTPQHNEYKELIITSQMYGHTADCHNEYKELIITLQKCKQLPCECVSMLETVDPIQRQYSNTAQHYEYKEGNPRPHTLPQTTTPGASTQNTSVSVCRHYFNPAQTVNVCEPRTPGCREWFLCVILGK